MMSSVTRRGQAAPSGARYVASRGRSSPAAGSGAACGSVRAQRCACPGLTRSAGWATLAGTLYSRGSRARREKGVAMNSTL